MPRVEFDRKRLIQYGEILERTLRDWETHAPRTTLNELRRDRPKCLFLCYAMEATIQTALDISNHLIAANGWEKPGTYRESFGALENHGLIRGPLCRKLQDLAGFRNVLVHRYPELKIPLVHKHLRRSHKPMRLFLRRVAGLLAP